MAFVFYRGSKDFCRAKSMCPRSLDPILYIRTQFLMIFTKSTMSLCHPCVQTYEKIFVYESSNYDLFVETEVDIGDAKWFIYIRMPLYPSISKYTYKGELTSFVKTSKHVFVL